MLSKLWSWFFNSQSIVVFLLTNQIFSPIAYNVSFSSILAYFDWFFVITTVVFYANYQVVNIFPEISKIFWWKCAYKYKYYKVGLCQNSYKDARLYKQKKESFLMNFYSIQIYAFFWSLILLMIYRNAKIILYFLIKIFSFLFFSK